MQMNITNSEKLGLDFLMDIAEFQTLDCYLESVIGEYSIETTIPTHRAPSFLPKSCYVAHGGSAFWIVSNGVLTDDSGKVMKDIIKYPEEMRKFDSESMCINVDGEKREIFFKI